MRVDTTFGQFITCLQHLSVKHLDTGTVRNQICLGFTGLIIGDDHFTFLLGIADLCLTGKFCDNCKNYVGNLFFNSSKLFIRGLFKFDELFKEAYLDVPCETWDAIYENLPIMDTQEWGSDEDEECGIFIDGACEHFTCKGDNGVLTAVSGDKEIIFDEEKITFKNCSLTILLGKAEPEIKVNGNVINFAYKGMGYSLKIDGDIVETDGGLKITSLKDIVFQIV